MPHPQDNQKRSLGQMVQPAQQSAPQQNQNLVKEWDRFLAQPEMRAALIQFGSNILQPVAPGDTAAGLFGRSIASGATAAGRVQQQEQQREQQQAELGLREREVAAREEGVDVRREQVDVQREGIQAQLQGIRERISAEKRQFKTENGSKALELATNARMTALRAINSYNEAAAFDDSLQPINIDPSFVSPEAISQDAQVMLNFLDTGQAPPPRAQTATPEEIAASLTQVPQDQWPTAVVQLMGAGVEESKIDSAFEILEKQGVGQQQPQQQPQQASVPSPETPPVREQELEGEDVSQAKTQILAALDEGGPTPDIGASEFTQAQRFSGENLKPGAVPEVQRIDPRAFAQAVQELIDVKGEDFMAGWVLKNYGDSAVRQIFGNEKLMQLKGLSR